MQKSSQNPGRFLRAFVALSAAISLTPACQAQSNLQTFIEKGDPDLPAQKITVDITAVNQILKDQGPGLQGLYKDRKAVALKALAEAKKYAEQTPMVSRSTTPSIVLEFMRPFGFTDISTRFCAMGATFSYCKAYFLTAPKPDTDFSFDKSDGKAVDTTKAVRYVIPDVKRYYFTPSPACQLMVESAKRRKMWVPRTSADQSTIKPGWLVFYNWDREKTGPPVSVNARAQHVGIVDHAGANGLYTVEFNTNRPVKGSKSNGGAVAEKTEKERPYGYVIGYIKAY